MTTKQLKTPTWCPGCGDFAIMTAFKNACNTQKWDNFNSVAIAGIGCHGHMINYLDITGFEGLHGRDLPVATGIKLANKNLNVFVFTGDGNALAEGGNHFVHTARRNHDLTVLLHDNAVYGLTTGQTSPASPKGFVSKSTPQGNIDQPLHPVTLAIVAGATFVARAYSGHMDFLRDLIIKANNHKGFAIIEILQPCVTFNRKYSHSFFQNNTYFLDNAYNSADKMAAIAKSYEWVEPIEIENGEKVKKIPTGIIYEDKNSISYEDQLLQIKEKSLIEIGAIKGDLSDIYLGYR